MISPKSYEEMATYLEKPEKVVFFFTANWCPDCQFIYPVMPEIEAENPEFTFVRVDRDVFMEVAQRWNIFGIPSFVVTENGKEIGKKGVASLLSPPSSAADLNAVTARNPETCSRCAFFAQRRRRFARCRTACSRPRGCAPHRGGSDPPDTAWSTTCRSRKARKARRTCARRQCRSARQG